MIDEKLALLRARRNNIRRYHRLLKTELTEFERRYIEQRLSEERSAMEELAASTFPLTFRTSIGEVRNATTPEPTINHG
jgi:5-bromo-4-chloroindolyl phosphate hydrolysis protein